MTTQATIAVLALALCCAGIIIAFGLYAMVHADRDALARQRTFVLNGIAAQYQAIAEQQESITVWDDAVTAVRAHDEAWILENLSKWMFDYYGHDKVYVLDEFDNPTHAVVAGELVPASAYDEVRPVIEPSVQALRLLMMQVLSGERSDETKPIVQDLVPIDGRPAIVSVMPIVSSSDRVTQKAGTEYLHVSVQLFDQPLIDGIASQYQLAEARLLPLTADPGSTAAVPLVDSRGAILGYFGWERDRPGLTFIQKTAYSLLTAALLAAGMLWYLLLRLRRASAQLERSQNETEFLAFHDTLTGLPNRALFEDRLQRAHVRRRDANGRVALLYIDLDRFKHVNDTLGHPAGDELVRQAAARLKATAGPADTVARIGGDEFAIVLEGARDVRQAEDLSKTVLEEIARPFEVLGHQVHIGASIGIAFGADADPAEMLRKADIALYEAKKKGRGRYEVFAGDMDELIARRRLIEGELRAALPDGNGLRLVYQPVYADDCATMAGAEALMRWDHPVHGGLPPSQFIAIAEERGMMEELGTWALRTACSFAANTPLPWVAVNVSPVQLREPDFAERVATIAADSGLPLSRLQIEITEGVLLDNGDHTRRNLAKLRQAGVRVALDDFGTGYSSVNYLRRYGIDKLKVDRSFVHMLGKDQASTPIVKAIIDLAKALDVKVTIEGVETVRQRDIVLSLGAQELQGFYFSEPLDAKAMHELIAGSVTSRQQRFRPANLA